MVKATASTSFSQGIAELAMVIMIILRLKIMLFLVSICFVLLCPIPLQGQSKYISKIAIYTCHSDIHLAYTTIVRLGHIIELTYSRDT